MLERFSPQSPEIPTHRLVDTLVIVGATQNSSGEEPRPDDSTRASDLAAALMLESGLAGQAAIIADPQAEKLIRNYLGDFGIQEDSIISRESGNESEKIREMVEDDKFGSLGFIAAGPRGQEVIEELRNLGLETRLISPEGEIGQRLAESAQSSRHAFTEFLKTAFMNVLRFNQAFSNVRLMRLDSKAA